MDETYDIIPANGHYDVYHNGIFYCSADTVIEAAKEIDAARIVNKEE